MENKPATRAHGDTIPRPADEKGRHIPSRQQELERDRFLTVQTRETERPPQNSEEETHAPRGQPCSSPRRLREGQTRGRARNGFRGNHPSGENFVRKTACAFFCTTGGQSRTAEMIFPSHKKRKLSNHGYTIQPPYPISNPSKPPPLLSAFCCMNGRTVLIPPSPSRPIWHLVDVAEPSSFPG